MPRWINKRDRIIIHIGISIPRLKIRLIWHNRIRADDPPQLAAVIAHDQLHQFVKFGALVISSCLTLLMTLRQRIIVASLQTQPLRVAICHLPFVNLQIGQFDAKL